MSDSDFRTRSCHVPGTYVCTYTYIYQNLRCRPTNMNHDRANNSVGICDPRKKEKKIGHVLAFSLYMRACKVLGEDICDLAISGYLSVSLSIFRPFRKRARKGVLYLLFGRCMRCGALMKSTCNKLRINSRWKVFYRVASACSLTFAVSMVKSNG